MDQQAAKKHIQESISFYKNNYSPQNISVYQYWAKVINIIDGDTLDLEISLGFNIKITERIRLIGVNTPEIHGVKKDSAEYKEGQKAMEFVQTFLGLQSWVEVEVYYGKREKYGLWLAQIFKDGHSLNEQLLINEMAKD